MGTLGNLFPVLGEQLGFVRFSIHLPHEEDQVSFINIFALRVKS
jgi:hypothetical protein